MQGVGAKGEHVRFHILDQFRGVAALSVLILHVFAGRSSGSAGESKNVFAAISEFTQWGCFGVDVFFVISGYCITASILKLMRSGGVAWHFMIDRMLRIYPVFWAAYAAAFLLRCMADYCMGRPLVLFGDANLYEFFAHIFLADLFFGLRPAMDVTWTLVHEMSFYLIAAFFLLNVSAKSKLLLSLAVLAGVFFSLFGINEGWMLVFQFMPEFLCGAVVCFVVGGHMPKWIGFVLLIALAGLSWFARQESADGETHIEMLSGIGMHFRLCVAALFAILLIFMHPMDQFIDRCRLLLPLKYLGKISFSLYLIHVPVVAPLINGLLRLAAGSLTLQILVHFSAMIFAVLSAHLLHRFVESRSEVLRRDIGRWLCRNN